MYTRPLSVSLLRTSKVDIGGTKLVAVGRKSVGQLGRYYISRDDFDF